MSEFIDNVSFLAEEKLILINDNITTLNVEDDLYFSWKRWVLVDNNAAYLPAFFSSFGLPTTSGSMLPIYYLINDWKIKTWNGNYSLIINGNLFTDTGNSFMLTNPDYLVTVKLNNSITLAVDEALINSGSHDEHKIDLLSQKIDWLMNTSKVQDDKLDNLVVINNTQDKKLDVIKNINDSQVTQLNNLDDLAHQILGLSKSNFRIMHPVYKADGVMTSIIQTYKSRNDMLHNIPMKTYRMTTDYDNEGRLQEFKVIETAHSDANTQTH